MAVRKTYTKEEKCNYYKNRVNDENLTVNQRNYAYERFDKLRAELTKGTRLEGAYSMNSNY